MGTENKDFLKELRAMFRVEADEHLSAMSAGTLELKKGPSADRQAAIVENAFREVHSLKGAARSVDMADIEAICQATESVFSALKRKEITLSPELFETLDQAIDTIANLVSSLEKERSGPEKDAVTGIIRQLATLVAMEPAGESSPGGEARREGAAPLSPRQEPAAQGERLDKTKSEDADVPAPETSEPESPTLPFAKDTPELPETVRISISKLDSLLLQAEEMLSLKLTAAQRVAGIRDVTAMLGAWRMEWAKVYPELRSIRKTLEEDAGPAERLQTALPLAKVEEFADWDHAHFKSFEGKLTQLASVAESDRRNVEAMVDKLAEDMKKTLMLPFSILLEVFPRFVRELSRDQGKDVDLAIRGGDTEIDRRILEEMKDPLVHLIRNCIDHGIEKPKDREQIGKPPRGTVTMAISHVNGNQIEVLVSDDGKGIDTVAVKDAAVKRGVFSKDAVDELSEQEALSLIFQSEVSTSPIITDISGRGLGLAIVQDKVGILDGFISLETKRHVGTLFRIVLPLTLATFRGILVRVGDRTAVIPSSNVERVSRIGRDEIITVESRETIQVGEHVVPLVWLDEILDQPRAEKGSEAPDFLPLLVLRSAEKRIAFRADEILNEQEVLLKSLGKQLSRVRNVTGAAVLGTGEVVPILNVPDLMKSAVKGGALPRREVATGRRAVEKRRIILVVEDSITSRMLLKNILESAGYEVRTAVDGVEGFTMLKTQEFDLVVSDVDMPRMNGFGLTSKIRGDKKLEELPVVLVTALDSREDRERGIEVGADSYIVKSSFDQSNLLDVVKRLIV